MAAPTAIYCDWAAGNDYKGATFADGAYTQATKNLLKTGAFTASQVGHWLYISGTHITTGYYKIATKTDNDNVVLATDASSDGSNSTDVTCTQADGTITKPWRSLQGALDLCTRDATNGNQINIKAGTAQVNNAALSLTTYGAPAEGAPIIYRGYTSAAGDGGVADIDCNGFPMFAVTTTNDVILADLQIYNGGNNDLVKTGTSRTIIYHCTLHKGASSPLNGRALINSTYYVIGCHIYNSGSNCYGVSSSNFVIGCYFYNHDGDAAYMTAVNAISNIFVDCKGAVNIAGDNALILGNTIYSSTARTTDAIAIASGRSSAVILNNIVEGYSGANGDAIAAAADIGVLGFNAYYNNAANDTNVLDIYLDLGNDAVLTASPFTNAAGGDFSLATGVSGAIDGAFPGAWYGPAGTTDHADIGAVQNGAGASTGAAVRIVPCGKVGL